MKSKKIYLVNQLCSKTVKGAIGYVPVFDDVKKAIIASDENKYAIRKMEIVNVNDVIAMKRNEILNNMQNAKL